LIFQIRLKREINYFQRLARFEQNMPAALNFNHEYCFVCLHVSSVKFEIFIPTVTIN